MTTEDWSEIHEIVSNNARIMEALANKAAEIAKERERISQFIAQSQEVIAQQQAEFRGLQTENRRILDILLNERQKDEPPEN
ncbi:MAG: hypothetical protein F6K22_06030 [Okeania sp. SIO2F4]|uniref:hypothetical protein n=1 Tax=Okeania sp. SIO2F4 TaxID=2607790 RepID=UPI001429F25E|nr:hypothetical protein [Okeania sp. SIO2F4]NES02435.1 hypothetical protein [Okeania sp. SIO2F4]